MKEQITPDWLTTADFQRQNPIVGIIEDWKVEGDDRFLILRLPDRRIVQMSVFKAQKNYLIQRLGEETTAWLGKTVRILRTEDSQGKVTRSIEA